MDDTGWEETGWVEVPDALVVAIRRAYDAERAAGLGVVLLAEVWRRVAREAKQRPGGFREWFGDQMPAEVVHLALAIGAVRGLTLSQNTKGYWTVVET